VENVVTRKDKKRKKSRSSKGQCPSVKGKGNTKLRENPITEGRCMALKKTFFRHRSWGNLQKVRRRKQERLTGKEGRPGEGGVYDLTGEDWVMVSTQ